MTIWLDAQLSPALAPWLATTFAAEVHPVRYLGLRDAKDRDIFAAARAAGAIVMTKDFDFVELVRRLGPPPQVIWLTCGNTSNARLAEIVARCSADVLRLLEAGEPLIEINDAVH